MTADHTIGQESFYVAVSRARYDLKLYTEDKDSLLALAQSSRAKENALSVLRQKELEKQHLSSLEKETVVNAAIVARSPEAEEREFEAEGQRSGGAEEQFYSKPSSQIHCTRVPKPNSSYQRSSAPVTVPNSSPLRPSPSAPLPLCPSAPEPPTQSPVIKKPVPTSVQPKVAFWTPSNLGERRPSDEAGGAGVAEGAGGVNPINEFRGFKQGHTVSCTTCLETGVFLASIHKCRGIKPPAKGNSPPATPATPATPALLSGEAPERLDSQHLRELVEDSAIHPSIAALNFKSLHQTQDWEHEAWEYLMYSDQLPRTNTGKLSSAFMSKYTHIESGGWWCDAGVNPKSFAGLQPGDKPDRKLWGCYKPNNPREKADKPGDALGQKNGGGLINPTTICDANTTNHEAGSHFSSHSPAKFIKYEHPPKTELSIFLLDVPDDIADRIYEKFGVQPTESDRTSGFWYCVWKHNLPVTITEGAKKAASLLSQGHPVIGLPGIYAGYRSKDELGEKMKARLMDELAVFATKEREITFCFDYETRPETQRNIEIAISRTGRLLEEQGASVSVVTLPGPNKGVDDLIVAQGALAYEKAYSSASTLKAWRDNNNLQRHLPPAPPKKLSDLERKQLLLQRFRGQLTQKAFKKAIDALTNRELLYLEQAVKEYFAQPVAQVPAPIDRQAIESEISHLQPQIDSLWLEHAHQEKAIRTMELFPLHQLSNKYNEALEQQLQTIGTIKELVTHKQKLQLKIQEYETKRENHDSWEKEQQTVEMKTMAQILKSPELQSRLTSIKDEIELKEQQLQARLSISRQPSPQPRRGLRR